MVKYYKKSLVNCLQLLHQASKNPTKNPMKWKILQEKLIRRHFYIESRIRENKDQIKDIQKIRKNPKERLNKEESTNAKNLIAYLEYQIEEYHLLLSCFKSIGDGIAYTFISRYDIKLQVFKEDAGFMSGKVGYKAEKKFFNKAFQAGFIAIMHDLTSVLRFRDLTIVDEDGYIPIEVKTSNVQNHRTVRQKERANQLFDYLYNDETEELFDIKEKIIRVSVHFEEKDHINLLNRLIRKSVKLGHAMVLAEKGLLYVVGHRKTDLNDKINMALDKHKIKEPFAHFMNARKFSGMGYFPFSLSIKDPMEYLNFLEGELVILVIMDQAEIKEAANRYGYEVVAPSRKDHKYEFKALDKDSELNTFSVSKHYLDRIGMEFKSMKWTYYEMFTRMNAKDIHLHNSKEMGKKNQ